ncbi:hypothetical protein AB6D66_01580 [Vibrio pomeroyi]|uniref:Phage protein n=1 Tax=Vibrio pomeroyi TaxID=198832 RepID=A0ABV4MRK1_9VIBR|nr:hypothetical protein [Vibrio atlanticus]MCZ4310185.1 hypothetical protein [Vibrio atlanticus]
MKIESAPGFTELHQQSVSNWSGDDPEVMQRRLFAGHEMIAVKVEDDKNEYKLSYLGFKAGGFFSMEQAKEKAGEFVKAVLMGMLDLIE